MKTGFSSGESESESEPKDFHFVSFGSLDLECGSEDKEQNSA